jgi:dimethylhistidine N-methyltransferase
MPDSVRYDYRDLKPAVGSFLDEVLAGLSAPRKWLFPKYFYDEHGSRLFDAICDLPEYYPTRTELGMLETYAPELRERVGTGSAIIEYGSGSGRKTELVLRAVEPHAYVAIDISGEQLRQAVSGLAARFPEVRMVAVCADYTRALALETIEVLAGRRRIGFFPGSTIGNFPGPEALAFLRSACESAGPGGAMIVGVDLVKDPSILHAAYNDAAGVTAAFNLNVLERINRELGADFELDAFRHRAHYAAEEGRVEMHLVSRRAQKVSIAGRTFHFAAGETIHTESSYKYSIEGFQSLAAEAGFEPQHCWIDGECLFSIHYLAVPH